MRLAPATVPWYNAPGHKSRHRRKRHLVDATATGGTAREVSAGMRIHSAMPGLIPGPLHNLRGP